MEKSDQIDALSAALSKCQSALKAVAKGNRATVRTKAGGTYSYQYADLADCWDALREPLTLNGLALMQMPESDPQGGYALRTMLSHESGQWMSFVLSIPADETSMLSGCRALGSGISYLRRYSLSVIGLVTDEDTDGADPEPAAAPSSRSRKQESPPPQESPATHTTTPATHTTTPAPTNYQGMAFGAATALWGVDVSHWAIRWHVVAYGGDGTKPSWSAAPAEVQRKTAMHLAAVEEGEDNRACSVCRLSQMAREVTDGYGSIAMETLAFRASCPADGSDETPTAKAILGETYEAFSETLDPTETEGEKAIAPPE